MSNEKEIPTDTRQLTLIQADYEKQQWEVWRVDQETGERSLVGTCDFTEGEQGRSAWAREVWAKKIG